MEVYTKVPESNEAKQGVVRVDSLKEVTMKVQR